MLQLKEKRLKAMELEETTELENIKIVLLDNARVLYG